MWVLNNDVIQPLCVILPQMNGYIKYFDDGGKICHLLRMMKKFIKSIMKYGKLLKVKFTVGPVRDDKYIVAKLKVFNGTNRATFTDNAIPIERNLYTCIPAKDIDSVLKMDNKRTYPQAYLEQCKYKLKKRKHVNFIDFEIIDDDSDDSYDSDNENENDFITSR